MMEQAGCYSSCPKRKDAKRTVGPRTFKIQLDPVRNIKCLNPTLSTKQLLPIHLWEDVLWLSSWLVPALDPLVFADLGHWCPFGATHMSGCSAL